MERQANTSLYMPGPPKNIISNQTRGHSLPDSKNRELIIRVNNRPLSEKASSPWFSFTAVFPTERALLLCELASEIPTWESLSRIDQMALNSSSRILGACPFGLTSSK